MQTILETSSLTNAKVGKLGEILPRSEDCRDRRACFSGGPVHPNCIVGLVQSVLLSTVLDPRMPLLDTWIIHYPLNVGMSDACSLGRRVFVFPAHSGYSCMHILKKFGGTFGIKGCNFYFSGLQKDHTGLELQ